jgi:anti-sigma regulatory factor (Ser/Thr protein kinase)
MEVKRTPWLEPGEAPRSLPFGRDDLSRVRSMVRREASEAGMSDGGSIDLVLAANEVATNSLKFGGGRGILSIWRQDGSLVCQISDKGYFDVESIMGSPRGSSQIEGRGLWLLDRVCDRVQISSSRQEGTTVRMHVEIH